MSSFSPPPKIEKGKINTQHDNKYENLSDCRRYPFFRPLPWRWNTSALHPIMRFDRNDLTLRCVLCAVCVCVCVHNVSPSLPSFPVSSGDIGGQMGLFIGASILTILEILDYIYEVRLVLFFKHSISVPQASGGYAHQPAYLKWTGSYVLHSWFLGGWWKICFFFVYPNHKVALFFLLKIESDFKLQLQSLHPPPPHTHTHTHTNTCVCVCVCGGGLCIHRA